MIQMEQLLSIRIVGKTSRWMRAGRKVSEWERELEKQGELTVENMPVVLILCCASVHQNHWEGDDSGGGGVKNTDALTPVYASLKNILIFPILNFVWME